MKITVIIGPQGSGKSIRARQLAASWGTPYFEIEAHELSSAFTIGSVLRNGARTLIVDGVPHPKTIDNVVVPMATLAMVPAHGKFMPEELRPSPRLIFCLHDDRDAVALFDALGPSTIMMERLS